MIAPGLIGERLALAAASSAAAATADLLQVAYDGDVAACRDLDGDTIPQLADALKMTIEYVAALPNTALFRDTEEAELVGQLQAALNRFLEGWA